ncbi:mitochondrial fission ELM1 family protein [Desertibaculum subflavum]|uniref:mitochondrial fission ELM1 family protein n=1 Tax=Desertibaculum subflavum TaxID=2268458 RepID=UPI0013C48AB8
MSPLSEATDAPRVWALLGDKAGDNAQVLALARALGWPFEVKRLAYRDLRKLPNLLFGASLATLDRRRSAPLAPPWPDLVIAVGRRSVPVARWIRRRAGGHARLVQIGRPRAPAAWFDLVVTTPQYAIAPGPNVIELPLPIATPAAADTIGDFEALPRPRIVALVGGPSVAFPLDAAAARRLREHLEAMAKTWQGSLLVTTSRRTPEPVAATLLASYAEPSRTLGFGATPGPSPYPRLLAAGDVFVVTADSASMLADAVTTGRPVFAFGEPRSVQPLPLSWRLHRRFGTDRPGAGGPLRRLYRWLLNIGLIYGPRRLDLLLARLYREGLVQELPDRPMPTPPTAAPRGTVAGLDLVVERVRRLMQER